MALTKMSKHASTARSRRRRLTARARRLTMLATALSVLLALAGSALQLPLRVRAAVGQQAEGARGASVRPKRPATRGGASAAPSGAPSKQRGNTPAAATRPEGQPTEMRAESLAPVLATADFDLVGLNVSASPATQSVPKNTPSAVLTSVQMPEGSDPAQIIAAMNPNYRVRGELTGPSLGSPQVVEARIGQPLPIPALAQAGDHLLQNLRVVDTGTEGEPVVASVTPDACGIVVIERLLISEVHVNELTPEQIRQAGINITDDSYRAFNFTLGVGTSSDAQTITIPVAFPTVGVTDPRPIIGVPSISAPGIDVPTIVPIMLGEEQEEGEGAGSPPQFGGEPVRIPGVVVFPGRVGFLHQFFEAIVIVANGAPGGAPLVLRNLQARAKLPDNGTPADLSDDPLRIAETQTGGRVSELELHGLGPDGKYGTPDDTNSFAPTQSGQATFLLEGLKEGLHTVNFDLKATLEGLPSGPVTVKGEVPGAVLVRDASFAVTFTHPGVVRAGQQYDLSMTLYNSGSRNISGAFAQLNANSISGAELIGVDDGRRQFQDIIKVKESATIKWRLRSNTTGAVTASYVKVGEGVSAGLALVTGVGDRNVPLSPESLILPDPVRHLPSDVVEAGRALLGQAWSIANAPSGSLPQGVAPIAKQAVVDRAVEMGIAGMRVDFGEPTVVSLETLLRDWLGELQENPDGGFADATRDTPAGFDWYNSLGAQLYKHLTAGAPTLDAVALHREFASTESTRSPFISALVTQADGDPLVGARLVDAENQRTGFGASLQERAGDAQTGATLPLDNINPLNRVSTGTRGQMLVVSNPSTDNWTLELRGWQNGTADISLLAQATSRTYRQLVWSGVQITQGASYRVRFKPLNTSVVPVLEELRDGTWQATGATATAATLNQTAPRVVGAIQVTPDVVPGGDKYGRLVGVLFSNPMSQATAETASRYKIGAGTLKNSNPAEQVGGNIKVTGAKLDYGDRFVFLGLDSTIGPYITRDLTVTGVLDARRMQLAPAPSTLPIQPRVSPQGIPPGAYLTGRVMNADGTPVAKAPVIYWVQECPDPAIIALPPPPKPIALQYTDAEGRYAIDYVRDGDCAPLSISVNNPLTHSEKRLTSPVAYDGQHMVFDMVFLARGNVQGTVTSGGVPLSKAFVQVVPDLDVVGTKVVQTDDTGRYLAKDVPVGNVSVIAVGTGDASNASGLAAGTINGPNQTATINVSLQDVTGVVSGRVVRADGNPATGTLVVAYSKIPGFNNPNRLDGATPVGYAYADRDGTFRIPNLPIGTIKLEATDYVTGMIVQQSVQLTATMREVTGVLIALPGKGTVTGKITDETGVPIANAMVSSAGRAVRSDTSGDYILRELPAGTQSIFALDPNTGLTGSAQAPVRLGETTANINIAITRPATIKGRVFIVPEGMTTPQPLAGAKVTVDGMRLAETDAQGNYTLNNIASNAELTLRFVDTKKALAVNMNVVLTPGETLLRDATLRSGSIHGKVFQPDGVTPTIAQVSVYAQRPTLTAGADFGLLSSDPPSETQSASDGSFSVKGVNPGKYRVASSNVFFPTRVSNGGTLAPNADEECNLTLVSTLAGKIQGRVFQPDGTTLVGAGVRVTLSGGSLADATVRTDDNGHFEFAEVFSAGGYNLTATDILTGYSNRTSIAVEKNRDAIADIRLLGDGGLRVRVIDGAGNPAQSGSVTIDGMGYPNQRRYAELTPESGGLIQFDHLTEGAYGVGATQRGLGGRAGATVPLGSVVELTIQLQASGSVQGKVFMPGGTQAIGLADVELRVGGRSVGFNVTQDDDTNRGSFSFLNVPTGDFTLDVFDNRTGRVGRSAGRVTSQNEVVTVNVELLSIGTVRGRVTANGNPVDHALVQIYADGSGLRGASARATTDPDGRYRFTGIPVGRFHVNVSDAPGGQTGSASGTVSGTIEPLPDTIADITLEPSQTITGTVYQAGGTQAVPGAQVSVAVAGRNFHTATNEHGAYRLDFVPLGQVRVRAEAPTGYDRGESALVNATQAAATVNINVTFAGTGTITGSALDHDGTPLPTGTITYVNDAWGGTPMTLLASVQANGRYEIAAVPVGHFTLKLTVPNRIEVGSASGDLNAGQTLDVSIRLEDAGRVTGLVKSEDGTTPVTGADVILSLSKQGGGFYRFYTHSDSQGAWAFNNIPLGTLSVDVTDIQTGGIARRSNIALAVNGQVVELGEMRIDNTPIRVESVTPANGATGITNTAPVISLGFSEPAQAGSVNSSTVQLRLGSGAVSASTSLSSDGRTVVLTPSARLSDSQTYTLVVSNGVLDLVGLPLASEFRSTFVTADQTAPVVTSITPANGSERLALDTHVAVVFNEPLDPAQDLSGVVYLANTSAGGQTVPGTSVLSADGRTITFTPNASLLEGTHYTVTVTGQRDAAGNAQAVAASALFTTLDLSPPVIDPLPIDGQRVRTFYPTITATYHDNESGIKTSTVVLTVDGANVTPYATVLGTGLTYQPPTPLVAGNHTVSVQVADNIGNLSAVRTATFTVDNSGPIITSFLIDGAPASDGMYVSSSLRPVFSVAYTDDTGINAAATRLLLYTQNTAPAQVAAVVTPNGLSYQSPTPLVEGLYTVEAVITNTLGTSTSTGKINFTLDVDAPDITAISPASGNQHGGTSVTINGARLLNSTGAAPTVLIGGNAATITSAVAGAPDTLVIRTPAGAPGLSTVEIRTDRGTGVKLNGFNYEADPRTPFISEPDTILLWHMDETANGQVRVEDAGPMRSFYGISSGASLAQAGRFAGGRGKPFVNTDTDYRASGYNPASFTVEGWMKTNPVGRTYTIFGKDDSNAYFYSTEYALRLLPNGGLRALVHDTGSREWKVETDGAALDVDDNEWHYLAMVVDRTANRLSIYVDGTERAASTTLPANFGAMINTGQTFKVGHYDIYDENVSGGPSEFPGALDEIRLSSTAHSAQRIQKTYLGTEGTLGIVITNTAPTTLARGTTTELQLTGYNLSGTTATATGSTGEQLPARMVATSATQARVQITVDASAPTGDAQLVISSGVSSATLALRIVDLERIAFTVEPDTRLLWHMDETANGGVNVIDSGTYGINGTASGASLAQAGRFAGGRARANIQVPSDTPLLYFGSSSFTVEGWMKTNPVGRTYTIFGKDDSNAYFFSTEFALRLLPSGGLRAVYHDTGNREWKVEMAGSDFDVDDNQWHYLALVVERTATVQRLSLYVDGVARAVSNTPPTNFGAQLVSGQTFKVGHYDIYDEHLTGGNPEFPGTLDEIRVSSTAHTSDQILNSMTGNTGLRVTSFTPQELFRQKTGNTPYVNHLSFAGYDLEGATAQLLHDGQPVEATLTVTASSYRQLQLDAAIAATAPLGPAQLVIGKAGQPAVTLDLRINQQSEIAGEADTLLLWRLNETGNGAVRIFDASALNINGTASNASLAQPGHFSGGRTRASIVSDADNGALRVGMSNLTVEGWMKTGPVGRTYTIFGKDDPNGYFFSTEYALRLLPSGGLRGVVHDAGGREWRAEMSPLVMDMDDGQWHHLALVMDRGLPRLSVYVDGVERAYSATMPANFGAVVDYGQPFRVGHYDIYDESTTGGNPEFPGTVDEIRVSSTAHSAARIAGDIIFTPGLRINSYSPREQFRGKAGQPYAGQLTVNGFNLEGVSARVEHEGQTANVTATLTSSSYEQAQFSLSVPANAPLGTSHVIISKAGLPDVGIEIRIVEQAQYEVDSDTLVLWRLNETGNGAVRILDAGRLPLNGTASNASLAQPGHFGGGRSKASIVADNDFGMLNFGTSNFTIDCWMKTDTVGRTYTLVGKDDPNGYFFSTEFALRLLPSGGLRGVVHDAGGREWRAEMAGRVYDPARGRWLLILDDNQWHHLSMVVDRTTPRLSLYVDGVERAFSATMPANFGGVVNYGQPLRVGHYDIYDESTTGGNPEFPGTLDEIRVSSTAHSAEKVVSSMLGTDITRVMELLPTYAQRGTSVPVTINGYGLVNASVTTDQPGVSVSVTSTSLTQINLNLNVPSTASIGQLHFTTTTADGQTFNSELTILDQQPFVNSPLTNNETLLLWHLDETGNGAVRINGAGDAVPNVLGGAASSVSLAQTGRFGGGRSKANITGDADNGALNFGTSNFTIDCWMKTDTVGRTYTLVGKDDPNGYFFSTEFALRLLPSGGLRGVVHDAGGREWRVELAGRVYDPARGRWLLILDDNQWHHLSMVVDRTTPRLSLYVDGVERAFSATMPANFGGVVNYGQPLRVGHYDIYDESTTGGNPEFPGTLDEIRFLNFARTPAQIYDTWFGTNTSGGGNAAQPSGEAIRSTVADKNKRGASLPDLRVTNVSPLLIARSEAAREAQTTLVSVEGAELNGLSGRVVRDGQTLDVAVGVQDSTDALVNLALGVAPAVRLGAAQLVLSKPGYKDAAFEIQITEQSEFALEADTVGLWHLDESSNGTTRLLDAGLRSPGLTTTAASRAAEGRFGGGRTLVRASAETKDDALSFDRSSFTIEGWVKTSLPKHERVLVGKGVHNAQQTEFALKLLPTGTLRAELYDANGVLWQAEIPEGTYNLTDNQWHSVALVVDRAAGLLWLYADGRARAASAIPAEFAGLRSLGQPLHFGDHGAAGEGSEEFAGTLDEIRISSTAHTAEKIARDFGGHDAPEITLARPTSIPAGSSAVPLTLHGYGLHGATVKASHADVVVKVVSASLTRLELLLSVPNGVPAGTLRLDVSDPLGQVVPFEVNVSESVGQKKDGKRDSSDAVGVVRREPTATPPPPSNLPPPVTVTDAAPATRVRGAGGQR